MKYLKICCCLCMLLFFSGCWDVEEIDQRDLILALGVDAAGDNLIRATAQIPLPEYNLPPSASGKTREKKFYVLSRVAHTILEAASLEQANTSRTLVSGQLKNVLFQETLARQGLKKYLDFLARTPKTPRHANVFITREPAEWLLDQVPLQEFVPGIDFSQQLESPLKSDRGLAMPLWRFIQRLDETGVDPYAPLLSYRQQSKTFEIIGLAVFRHDRLVGFLSPEETRMFGMITAKVKGGYLEVPLSHNEFAAFRSVEARSRIIPVATRRAIRFRVKIAVKGSLSELTGTPICLDPKVYQRIERQAAGYLKSQVRETIARLQAWEADILDFGLEYRAHDLAHFNPRTWRRRFREAKTDVTVDFKITRTGLYH